MADYRGRTAKELRPVFPTLKSSALIPCPVSVERGRRCLKKALAGQWGEHPFIVGFVCFLNRKYQSRKSTLALKAQLQLMTGRGELGITIQVENRIAFYSPFIWGQKCSECRAKARLLLPLQVQRSVVNTCLLRFPGYPFTVHAESETRNPS